MLLFETSARTHPVLPPLMLTLYVVVDPVLQIPLACISPAGACSRKLRQDGIIVAIVVIVVYEEDDDKEEDEEEELEGNIVNTVIVVEDE